jgi:hypothetical protein
MSNEQTWNGSPANSNSGLAPLTLRDVLDLVFATRQR